MTTTVVPPPTTDPGSPGDHLAGDRGRRALRESAPFLVLTYATALLLALALPGTVENPGPVSLLTLLTPAVVVGLLRLRSRRRHGPVNAFPLGLRRSGLRSWPVAVALPLVAIGGSLAAAAALGVVRFDGLLTSVAQAPLDIAVMTVLVLGEEIGWRSYLFPRLATVLPARRAALVTGFAQGLFHLPLLLLTPAYDGDGSRWIVVPGGARRDHRRRLVVRLAPPAVRQPLAGRDRPRDRQRLLARGPGPARRRPRPRRPPHRGGWSLHRPDRPGRCGLGAPQCPLVAAPVTVLDGCDPRLAMRRLDPARTAGAGREEGSCPSTFSRRTTPQRG